MEENEGGDGSIATSVVWTTQFSLVLQSVCEILGAVVMVCLYDIKSGPVCYNGTQRLEPPSCHTTQGPASFASCGRCSLLPAAVFCAKIVCLSIVVAVRARRKATFVCDRLRGAGRFVTVVSSQHIPDPFVLYYSLKS